MIELAMIGGFVLLVVGVFAMYSIHTIRPTERAFVERFGKYNRFARAGLLIIIPFVEKVGRVNVTEQMVDAEEQEVITNDDLNAKVDAQIYFKVKSDEESVKNAMYNVNDYRLQIVQLARTTLRDIIGNMTLSDANSKRSEINEKLAGELQKETATWGIQVVRAELKEIEPPEDVQDSMNRVVKAYNEKTAALDIATAEETKADGRRRAAIKEAEGMKRAEILEAEGRSNAIKQIADAKAHQIKVVNESAEKYFKGNAVNLKKLETAEVVLEKNSKIIVPQGADLVNVVGDSMGIIPIKDTKKGRR